MLEGYKASLEVGKLYRSIPDEEKQQTVHLISQDLERKMVIQLVTHPESAPRHNDAKLLKKMAEPTGLEPATSDVTE